MAPNLFKYCSWSVWTKELYLSTDFNGNRNFFIHKVPSLVRAQELATSLGAGVVEESKPNEFQSRYGLELIAKAKETSLPDFIEWFSKLDWPFARQQHTVAIAKGYYLDLTKNIPDFEIPAQTAVTSAVWCNENNRLKLFLDIKSIEKYTLDTHTDTADEAFALMCGMGILAPLTASYKPSFLQKVVTLTGLGRTESEITNLLGVSEVEVRKARVRYKNLTNKAKRTTKQAP